MRATITVTAAETRVLVEDEEGDRLLARLPGLSSASHPRALPTLLEALALWCGRRVPVVLSVDELFEWERSGLSEALEFGADLFYCVEIVPHHSRPRRGAKRLSGLGSFSQERSVRRRAG